MNVLVNEIELKQNYDYNKMPVSNVNYAYNLSSQLGASTYNYNAFDHELSKLVKDGTLVQVYDFVEDGFREGLYNFADSKGQISFHGKNHMGLKLFYNY